MAHTSTRSCQLCDPRCKRPARSGPHVTAHAFIIEQRSPYGSYPLWSVTYASRNAKKHSSLTSSARAFRLARGSYPRTWKLWAGPMHHRRLVGDGRRVRPRRLHSGYRPHPRRRNAYVAATVCSAAKARRTSPENKVPGLTSPRVADLSHAWRRRPMERTPSQACTTSRQASRFSPLERNRSPREPAWAKRAWHACDGVRSMGSRPDARRGMISRRPRIGETRDFVFRRSSSSLRGQNVAAHIRRFAARMRAIPRIVAFAAPLVGIADQSG